MLQLRHASHLGCRITTRARLRSRWSLGTRTGLLRRRRMGLLKGASVPNEPSPALTLIPISCREGSPVALRGTTSGLPEAASVDQSLSPVSRQLLVVSLRAALSARPTTGPGCGTPELCGSAKWRGGPALSPRTSRRAGEPPRRPMSKRIVTVGNEQCDQGRRPPRHPRGDVGDHRTDGNGEFDEAAAFPTSAPTTVIAGGGPR